MATPGRCADASSDFFLFYILIELYLIVVFFLGRVVVFLFFFLKMSLL